MSSAKEALEIPESVRLHVLDRDYSRCRMCGRTDLLVLHHIHYGGNVVGMGGRRKHDPENIITLGGFGKHDCHRLVHSNKGLWVPVLDVLTEHPVMTGLQITKWAREHVSTDALGIPTDAMDRLRAAGHTRKRD